MIPPYVNSRSVSLKYCVKAKHSMSAKLEKGIKVFWLNVNLFQIFFFLLFEHRDNPKCKNSYIIMLMIKNQYAL